MQVPYMAKPWTYLCQHPFKDRFFAVLDATPYKGWRPMQRDIEAAAAEEVFARLPDKICEVFPEFDKQAFLWALAAKMQIGADPMPY